MALNYLQRVAMSETRTAAPVRPAALGPPPMPGVRAVGAAPPVLLASEAVSTAPIALDRKPESPQRAARAEVPPPPQAPEARQAQSKPGDASQSKPSQPKPAAVIDRLLGPALQTVVRVPRSLKRGKPAEPIQPVASAPSPDVERPEKVAESTRIEPLTAPSAASRLEAQQQPRSAPKPMPQTAMPHLVETESAIELDYGPRQRGEHNEPAQPLTNERHEDLRPALVRPVPPTAAEAFEALGLRSDQAQPANYTAPLRLAYPAKREKRISIGRVEVQVNNHPIPSPPPTPPHAPATGADTITGRYLGRFALRP